MTRPAVRLPEELRQQIVQHCLEELPNEGCGLFAVDGADIVQVYPTSNLDDSPVSFTVPPEAHIEALTDALAQTTGAIRTGTRISDSRRMEWPRWDRLAGLRRGRAMAWKPSAPIVINGG